MSELQPYRPGNRDDFDRLYRDSHRRIVATLTAVLGDHAAAEDCAQDTFVQAFRSWGRWRPDAPAEAWLHRIAINTAHSFRRRQRLREVGEVIKRLGRPADPPDPAEEAGDDTLLLALRRLPPAQSAALVLRHYHGYTNREIAGALGIPERTVASRLAAAKSRLRQDLQGYVEASGAAVSGESGSPGVVGVVVSEGPNTE
jgi:RNA polymerase sigma-70 factor (ECF subfamily)